MREEISVVQEPSQRPQQSSADSSRNGRNQRKYSDAVTEVIQFYKQKLMSLKTPVLQCQNGLVA
jgi:hypothetical protein